MIFVVREDGAGELQAHHADAAEADDGDRLALEHVADFLQRGERGDARAHVGGGEAFGHAGCVEQVFRMGDEDVFGIAAGDLDADLARLGADVFLVTLAGGALAAADPREDDEALADLAAFEQRLRIGANGRERAFDLVAERVGQRAALGPVDLVAIADVDMAVLQVDVGMADAGEGDLHERLACPWGPGCRR